MRMGLADSAEQRVLFKAAGPTSLLCSCSWACSSCFQRVPFSCSIFYSSPISVGQSFLLTSLRVSPKPCWFAFHSLGCCCIGVCSLVLAPPITSSSPSVLNDASPSFHLPRHTFATCQPHMGRNCAWFCQQYMTRQQVQGLLDT